MLTRMFSIPRLFEPRSRWVARMIDADERLAREYPSRRSLPTFQLGGRGA